MSQSSATDVQPPQEPSSVPLAAVPAEPEPASVTESLLDNLSAWTVVAAAISLLYLVWVTFEVLNKYVGIVPKVGP